MGIDYTLPELMVTAAAREISNREIVFVGMRLPLLGFLLAKTTHAPEAVGVYELGITRETVAPEPILTMGDLPNLYRAQWLADTCDVMALLQRGMVDASFIGGAQIDRFGNLIKKQLGEFSKSLRNAYDTGDFLEVTIGGSGVRKAVLTQKALDI